MPQKYEPKKTDFLIGLTLKKDIADKLDISPRSVHRLDELLILNLPAYKSARLGPRQPFTDYQIWCLQKVQHLKNRGMTGKALQNYIRTNQEKLTYEAFTYENHRISKTTQN